MGCFKYCIPSKGGQLYSMFIKVLCGDVESAWNCSCLGHEEIMELPVEERYERYCKACLDTLERGF